MQPSFGTQMFSFFGAMLVLVAYVGHQMKWMKSGALYNFLNAAGSAILASVALRPFQLGFVVMEGAWVIVSLYALVRVLRSPQTGRS